MTDLDRVTKQVLGTRQVTAFQRAREAVAG